MSDAVYDDVISTESERVEMMVAIYESVDCVRDHDFRTEKNTHHPLQRTGSDSVKIRSSRSAVVCLVLLCVLLLTAVIVLCVHIHTNNTNYTEETHQLRTRITSLTEERAQLLTNITDLTEERIQIQTNNSNLIQLNKKLMQEKKELLKCFVKNRLYDFKFCVIRNQQLIAELVVFTDGWFYYHSSCYYTSYEWKSWNESRRYCTERGADLIIINNEDEQKFIMKEAGISESWIGLTDTDVEGTWKWVDGSTLTSGFWKSGEPNGDRRENCVVSHSSGWNDYPCHLVSRSIFL
ncbi:CD209 antigen-like protein B [Labeo rohita]|uniref:CD209 antigen-like protein B n=1 Tax=Labeo rohita TaxID=84645 RepID=UPI0021E1DAEE|nr:CD209 antigen-like protein B [Labeo rohita]